MFFVGLIVIGLVNSNSEFRIENYGGRRRNAGGEGFREFFGLIVLFFNFFCLMIGFEYFSCFGLGVRFRVGKCF